jgi:hypothetical protein
VGSDVVGVFDGSGVGSVVVGDLVSPIRVGAYVIGNDVGLQVVGIKVDGCDVGTCDGNLVGVFVVGSCEGSTVDGAIDG